MAGAELAKPAASLTSVMVKRKGRPADAAAPEPTLAPIQDAGLAARPRRPAPEKPAERPVAPPPVEPAFAASPPLGATAAAAAAPSAAMRRTAAAATAVVAAPGLVTWRNVGIVGLVYLAALFIIAAAFNF
jgi:hypothetical protein